MLLIGGGGGVGIDDFLLTIFDFVFTILGWGAGLYGPGGGGELY